MSRGMKGTERLGEAFDSPHVRRIFTCDRALQGLLASLPRYAQTDLPVLILGEPGTGKELIAEALWALSLRAGRAGFVFLSEKGKLKTAFTALSLLRPGPIQ